MSVKRGPDTCGWRINANGKIRMEKCGKTPKKVKRIKREKRMAKMNKQTKENFFSSLCRMVGPFMYSALSIVGTGYSGFFHNSLNLYL